MTASSSTKGRPSRAKVRRRDVKAASLRRWVSRARAKGLKGAELVFDLHVRRGLKLPEVAEVLGLGVEVVREHWRESCAARAPRAAPAPPPKSNEELLAGAPRTEADFAALRERISLALWQAVVATYPVSEGRAEGGDGAAEPKVSPRLVSLRMRALRQMGKIHGVGRKKRGGRGTEFVPPPCATPEEIAAMVREWRRRRETRVDG